MSATPVSPAALPVRLIAAALCATFTLLPAQAADSADLQQIRREIDALRQAYEARIKELESRLSRAESGAPGAATSPSASTTPAPVATAPAAAPARSASSRPAPATGGGFNPNISLILSGGYAKLSQNPEDYRITGFTPGGEIGPGSRGFTLSESELGISANIDHLFYGQANIAISPENEVSAEEAFIQTTALPAGLQAKAGRFFSGIGYQNEQHAHTWDFVDSPLVYQAFLGRQFSHDGVQLKWLAPSDTFIELGAEAGSGNRFPGAERTGASSRNGAGAHALFAHVGGDIGTSYSWRTGLSYLRARPRGREYEDTDLAGNSVTNAFTGDSRLVGADFVLKWAPNGNAQNTSFKLQGEYFRRKELGDLTYDTAAAAASDTYSASQSGWYLQGVYQFLPAWRVGLRQDQLKSGRVDLASNAANLASPDYKPRKTSLMFDWSPSEFSRVRLQFARDNSRQDATDKQIFLQYQMSLGAHGAHSY